jgi:hypothetical protein
VISISAERNYYLKKHICNSGEVKMKLEIIYPDKPGFALLAYEILQEISRLFELTGGLTAGQGDRFSVSLGTHTIYSKRKANCSAIDQGKILLELAKHKKLKKGLDLSTQSSQKEMTDIEDFTDCFCSGE